MIPLSVHCKTSPSWPPYYLIKTLWLIPFCGVLLHSIPPPLTTPPHLPRPHSKQAEPMTREICIILVLFLNCLEKNTVWTKLTSWVARESVTKMVSKLYIEIKMHNRKWRIGIRYKCQNTKGGNVSSLNLGIYCTKSCYTTVDHPYQTMEGNYI